MIGEAIRTAREGGIDVSMVREISADDAITETLRETLMKREALGVVNFYISAQTNEVAA